MLGKEGQRMTKKKKLQWGIQEKRKRSPRTHVQFQF